MDERSTAGGEPVSEFELACAACGGQLSRTTVSGVSLGVGVERELVLAECADCGERYFPRETLEELA
ncbi:hypothetical protein SAMN05192554_11277 [Haloarchaeobius iranensis]|uniref:YgiT-type zinc finger domain-containing protein n=2 Tax=Haloarchaeobius iranensis TaxID=996166 RepID=A0A1G9Y0V9_9EURY|nr:hypothetical protein SAMN05192554_11277 [Haloarchaeobius iranensis]